MKIDKLKIKDGVTIYASEDVSKYFNKFSKGSATLVFEVASNDDLDNLCEILTSNTDCEDTLIWAIYLKGKKELNRNTIMNFCDDKLFRPVSQVSLDDSYSGLRLRYRRYVK